MMYCPVGAATHVDSPWGRRLPMGGGTSGGNSCRLLPPEPSDKITHSQSCLVLQLCHHLASKPCHHQRKGSFSQSVATTTSNSNTGNILFALSKPQVVVKELFLYYSHKNPRMLYVSLRSLVFYKKQTAFVPSSLALRSEFLKVS